jgi:hypothetical protein
MTTAVDPTRFTVRDLLAGNGADDRAEVRHSLARHDALGQHGGELSRLTSHGREAGTEALTSVVLSMLAALPLGGLLVDGWRTQQRVVSAARETLRVRGREEVVELAKHRLACEVYPTVDVLIDGIRRFPIHFRMNVLFDVEVAALIIRYGQLVGLRAGNASAEGTLAVRVRASDVELVRTPRRDLDLRLITRWADGIPLLPEAGQHAAPDLSRSGLSR